MHRHQGAGDKRDKNTVENVKPEQGMGTDLTAAEQERTGIVDRNSPDKIREESFVT
jgi:hypothetical protein